ncbi:MAG TPA: hypothetical protein VFK54_05475 [Candidatus Limnocylindrales bacterium]|nr:hypothetical protein [Candidatus Limnocylindrales bacterium]
MARSPEVTAALATLQARWGAAAPRAGVELGLETEGALARAPVPVPLPSPAPEPERAPAGRVIPTGFAALDAILGLGGLPRDATVALAGDHSSGKTTLALRLAAQAQADGAIVAWVDLARAFDPVEAVARGIRPEWLVVLTPADLEEALSLAATLLSARTVDVLLIDLPEARDPAVCGMRIGDRLGRLAALARRAGALLVLLEPPSLGERLGAAVAEASGLRLQLIRSGWVRLGRDVVGQETAVRVARNRFGPPGREAALRILYAEGGSRDACLARDELLASPEPRLATIPAARLTPVPPPSPSAVREGPSSTDDHATPPPVLAPPAAPSGPRTTRRAGGGRSHLRLVALGADRPRRAAVDGRDGPRRQPPRACARGPARDAARERPSTRTRGDLPRPRP